MAKQGNFGIFNRLRELLAELDRLLNPPRPVPVRVPVRSNNRQR
jgi:hypothetical protein